MREASRGFFIRHYDLASIGKAAAALRDRVIDSRPFLDSDFARLVDAIAASPLTVVAAINGICMGGGLEIALACDIRIAQHDVEHIGFPEIRVDIFPEGGGTQRLARLIGEATALDMALRGTTASMSSATPAIPAISCRTSRPNGSFPSAMWMPR